MDQDVRCTRGSYVHTRRHPKKDRAFHMSAPIDASEQRNHHFPNCRPMDSPVYHFIPNQNMR